MAGMDRDISFADEGRCKLLIAHEGGDAEHHVPPGFHLETGDKPLFGEQRIERGEVGPAP